MRPFYDARVGDLGPDDYVYVKCECCFREHAFSGETLRLLNLPLYEMVRSLAPRLKCKSCGERGRVDLSIAWAR
jgi:hypothetical protein